MLRFISRRAPLVLAAVALAAFASLTAIVDLESGQPRLVLDATADTMIPQGSADRLFYEGFKDLFNSEEATLIALSDDDIVTTANLARIERITDRVGALPQVERVLSLTTALNIRSEDGDLIIAPFVEEIPETEAELSELRERIRNDPIYSGNLVSRDGRVSVVVVNFLDLPSKELVDDKVDEQIGQIVEEERGNLEAWTSGRSHAKAAVARSMMRDLTTLLPLSWVVMGLVAYLSFRTFRGVLIPLLTVQISMLGAVAFIAMRYGAINVVTVAAPPVLVVVGMAYAIHVISAYYDVVRDWPEGRSMEGMQEEIVFRALAEVSVPVIFTGATTMAGFFSLMTSPLEAVQQFGVFCGIGTGLAMIVSLTFVPALLRLMPVPTVARTAGTSDRSSDRSTAFFKRMALFDINYPRAIFAVAGLVALASVVGMFLIEVRTDMMMNFKKDSITRKDFDRINEHLEGANMINVVLEARPVDAFKDPANLRIIEDLQTWLEEQPEVGGTTSIVDYVKTLNRGFHDAGEDAFRIPESRELVSQLLLLGGYTETERFVDFEYEVANIEVRNNGMDSATVSRLVDRIRDRLHELPPELETHVTGNAVLLSQAANDVAVGQIISLTTAMIFIYGFLSLLFMSFTVGLVALIPSALPILVYFGLLGWFGIPLSASTALLACIVLGIAVDDTIHLMAHFNAAAKRHADENKGMIEALCVVGRPITITTLALSLGFLVLALSDSQLQTHFGLLSAATVALAWLADMTLTPALASRMRVVNLWDVVTTDLGDAPESAIPLFSGLRRAQARMVALMTKLSTYPAGHELLRVGEQGDEMYVVVEGTLEAWVVSEDDGSEVVLRKLERGDVIGEIGLFRGVRSANVRTQTKVRLLCLTKESLDSLKRRYPRIGAQIYSNLSEVLAGRLTAVTGRLR